MRILLDENLPHKLVAALRKNGHEAESVHILRMDGLDNGRLYRFAVQHFDILITCSMRRQRATGVSRHLLTAYSRGASTRGPAIQECDARETPA